MRTLVFAGLAALTLAAPATAATDNAGIRRVIESMGLMGEWGVDCDAMPSSTEWETIAVSDKGVVQSIEGGDDVITTYNIIEATRLNRREIRMKLQYIPEDGPDNEGGDYSPDEATTVVYRVEANRQMTWSSVGPDGEPLITRGQFVTSDGSSKWYNRCPAQVPAQ